MLTSVRNCFEGRIIRIVKGAVNDEIFVMLTTGEEMVSVITHESAERLGLYEGRDCHMLIKASLVVILQDCDDYVVSCRNVYPATITEVHFGKVATEVDMVTDRGMHLTASITVRSSGSLKLALGTRISAVIKSHHVIVAVKKA